MTEGIRSLSEEELEKATSFLSDNGLLNKTYLESPDNPLLSRVSINHLLQIVSIVIGDHIVLQMRTTEFIAFINDLQASFLASIGDLKKIFEYLMKNNLISNNDQMLEMLDSMKVEMADSNKIIN